MNFLFSKNVDDLEEDLKSDIEILEDDCCSEVQECSNEVFGSVVELNPSSGTDGVENVAPKKKRPRKELVTPKLAAVLDKCKISERDSVHLLHAFLEAVSLDSAEYVINRTSIRRQRNTIRQNSALASKKMFLDMNLNTVTVHWDGKMLPKYCEGGKYVERLAVIASANNTEKLLGVPEVSTGTGEEISSAVYDVLKEWDLISKVQAFSFDTTASNTGRKKGACTLLERKLDKSVLLFGCRHHIAEVILSTVFKNFLPSTGPNVALFKRFKENWINIRTDDFEGGRQDLIQKIFGPFQNFELIIDFCVQQLNEKWPRNDYREFLELILLFLEHPSHSFSIKQPGAFGEARWMAKGIYSLKIYLFRQQFKLTSAEEDALLKINAFIVKCYAQYWFVAHRPEKAPLADLRLLRNLDQYPDKEISKLTIKKFVNHLYYLNEESISLSLYDDEVSPETKSRMCEKILELSKNEEHDDDDDDDAESYEDDNVLKKMNLKVSEVERFLADENDTILIQLISENTKTFFSRYSISVNFLEKPVAEWRSCLEFLRGEEVVKSLRVTNDAAERGIKLLTDYNESVTKNAEQQKYLLQVLTKYFKIKLKFNYVILFMLSCKLVF